MTHSRTARRFLSLALTGALLLPSLTGIAPALADDVSGGVLDDTYAPLALTADAGGFADHVSLNFPLESGKWTPTESPSKRLWLDITDDTYVVDDFTYSVTSDKDAASASGAKAADRYGVDQYGYLTLKAGKTPIAGETLTVTANVDYYSGDDVVWAENVTSSSDKSAFDGGTASYTIAADSSVVSGTTTSPAQVARTGEYGMTTSTSSWNKAPYKQFATPYSDVTFTAWYYDPVASDEVFNNTAAKWEAQIGAHINQGATDGGPASYLLGLAYISGITDSSNYRARKFMNGSAAGSTPPADQYAVGPARSEGWHRLTWNVTNSGCVMSIDGHEIQTITSADAKTLSTVSITVNKGQSTVNQAIVQNKHFMDDLSVVKTDATLQSDTLTCVIPVNYTAPSKPVIGTQPADRRVAVGENVSFTVAATNPVAGNLTYQWYSCNADGSNPASVSSATTPTLILTNVALGVTHYYCEITNASGAVKTNVVKLTVLSADSRLEIPRTPAISPEGILSFGYTDAGSPVDFTIYLYASDNTSAPFATLDKTLQPDHSNFVTGVSLLSELRTHGLGTYYATVQARGADDKLDSLVSDSSNTVAVSKLPQPVISGWQGSSVLWAPVSGAKSYSVQLYKGGTASGSPVTVAHPATSAALPVYGVGPFTATVTAIADTAKSLYLDSIPSAPSSPMPQDLRLTMDGVGLHKGETARVYLESPSGAGIDGFQYKVTGPNADKVTIDQYGSLSMVPGFTPSAGDSVTVEADVSYYPGTIFSYNFEAKGGLTLEDKNISYSGTSALANGQAARTGRLGGSPTSSPTDGSSSAALGGKTGNVVFWYYDPCTPQELTDAYSSQAKFGVTLNAYKDFLGIAIPTSGEQTDGGATASDYAQHYSYRQNGTWKPTGVVRTPGWHKMEFRVTAAGAALWIDGADTGILNTNVTAVSSIILATNWGNQGDNGSYINNKHFIDDIYFVDTDAEVTTTTISTTVSLLPTQYTLAPERGSYELQEPGDLTVAVSPDLTHFTTATLDSTPLTQAQYSISGNNFTVLESAMAGLSIGVHTLTLSIEGQDISYPIDVTSMPGRNYYISNSGDNSKDGLTPETAWKTLSKLNAITFKPGDKIYLDAQSIWNEQLVLRGDGSAKRPIQLTRYNQDDAHLRPVINGMGTVGTKPSYIVQDNSSGAIKLNGAVELWNSGYWEISWLEVTNMGATPGDGRSGIMVINDYCPDSNSQRTQENWWASRKDHVSITDCYVHDVNGKHQAQGGTKHAGGIIGYGYISDFTVERCRVSKVDNEGIRNTIFNPGGTNSPAGYPADAATYLTFKNNFIDKVSGDAMVMAGGNYSDMSYNVATTLGRSYLVDKTGTPLTDGAPPVLLGTQNYAAMWVMGCKNSVAQYNEVFDTQYDCPDGEAWDIDLYSENYVYQYNYSHNNAGGCVLFMNNSKNNIFRYNLSINDGGHFSSTTADRKHLIYYAASGGSTANAYPLIYNNVFNLSADISSLIDGNSGGNNYSKYIHVQNNIFYAPNDNRPRLLFWTSDKASGELSHNIFWPADLYSANITGQLASTAVVSGNLTVDPKLADTTQTPTISTAWFSQWDTDNALTTFNWFDANVNSMLGGYKLTGDSPAIDAGVKVPYWPDIPEEDRFPITRDFFGNPIDETDSGWMPDIGINEYAVPVPEGSHKVSFSSNGGGSPVDPSYLIVADGETVGTLPAAPTRAEYIFTGWNTAADGSGTEFTAATPVTANLTVFAQWKPLHYTYTVTFDKNGGTTEAKPGSLTVSDPATTLGKLPTAPTRTGYEFAGWNTAADGSGAVFIAKSKVTADTTVYAQWKPIGSFTVTYDKNGGDTEASPAFQIVAPPATNVGTLPVAPTRAGYTFEGWNTDKIGSGTLFTADTAVKANVTVYAQWKPVTTATYTVTFDKNGGDTEATPASAIVAADTTVGVLPTAPTYAGYTFVGWNTQPDGKGAAFSESTIVSASITVYAQWTANTPDPGPGPSPDPSPATPAPTPETPAGNVTTNGSGKVETKANTDGSTTYTFVPNAGESVLYIRVNGLLVPAGSYTAAKGDTPSIVAIFGDPDADHTQTFADTANMTGYQADAVNYAVSAGLFQGVNSGSFAPQGDMSRAMFATVLARLYGANTTGLTSSFTDVKPGTWYEGSVAWAAEMGFTSGVSATSFAPDTSMTRQELVTLVYRFAQKVGADVSASGDLSAFSDTGSVDVWATDAMTWAVGLGLINGRGDSLAPTDTITRLEAAIVLERMSTLLVKN